ncbi:CWF19-like protein 2 [Solenopsis invicta]|uniref:CWF19-like protein 2 n=1 Tax=Solenopsis invicta TaxID=13686 RepID=UPI000E33EEF1|nr:CWF19-like protein 2 [Solenopsis invicta]XP_025987935.1 CWF19-like protein 2 [Solenopsis invicta]XP_025987936.1 CWF19-like protein 2 [Solenopsis invicta]XP_025987937.1 CWF19-like protein 2 [Solenopsis invicta]XP_025987938.1 CWF19-like protein 2 [Solenopsis invicta]
MEHINTCKTQVDKVKCSTEDIKLFVHRKSNKKSKKKKVNKKENKKHKKKRRSSSSSSSSECDDSSKFEWVEKNEDRVLSGAIENPVDRKVQENQLKRDEWMNVESFVPYLSKPVTKAQSSDKEERDKILLDKPGQSGRELNPYWKDGGDGLPRNNPGKSSNPKILDANWLKKSLRRAKEQAFRDGKRLEEVAAERWGSLETIQAMIIEAERMSSAEQNKSYRKRSLDRNDKDSQKIHRIRKHSRSRSRSRDRVGKYKTFDYSSERCTELKQTYEKSKDNDDYYNRQTVPASSWRKKWKKDGNDEKKCQVVDSRTSELKQVDSENIANTSEMAKDKGVDVLTKAEMNKLGAKIIKAELMGDEELAARLKTQLEHARKHVASRNTNEEEEAENVILTKTDAKGTARPIQPRNQSKRENDRKKIAETHISGERVRHFVDDDKYSLQEMFQREKGRSTTEDEAILTKLPSRSMDHMDDIFEREIARTDSEMRRDKRDRAEAIKEHKDLSKRMDNCWWCLDSKNMLKHMIVTMDSVICLSLPACTSLSTGHCILTPIQHVACQLQLDEDVWDRLKELKRKLTRMFTDEDFYPIFFEVYKRRCKFSHMQLECIPLPREIGELAPIYFKKALLECEIEWSVNKKVIDLTFKGIRHAVPNGLSYFMVEFASHPGYAHVIEDEEMFPHNFAKEVIGGMLDLDHNLWRKPKRQSFEEQRVKVLEFTEKWKKYNVS